MIKNFNPMPFNGIDMIPKYATNVKIYVLNGKLNGGYMITLGKLTIGNSMSMGKQLSHALFESFTDHGARAKTAKTRTEGEDREIMAAKNAMAKTGIEFFPVLPDSCENMMYSLGQYFQNVNPDIETFNILSQRV